MTSCGPGKAWLFEWLSGREVKNSGVVRGKSRGDRAGIHPERHRAKCRRHHVPFEEHWFGLEHARACVHVFVAYNDAIRPEAVTSWLRNGPSPIDRYS